MKMTFGKFKGTEIKTISKNYLNWLLTLDNLQADLRDEITSVLNENNTDTKVSKKEVVAAKITIQFGKYKGLRIAEIATFDCNYLDFLERKENSFSKTIEKAFEEMSRLNSDNLKSKASYVKDFLANEAIQYKIEDDKIIFNVPFLLKDEFKKHFKTNSKFDFNMKKWTVKNTTRNINKLNKSSFFVEVVSFTEYSTVAKSQESYVRSEFPDLNFDSEYVQDCADDFGNSNYHNMLNQLVSKAIEEFLKRVSN